MLLWKYRPSRPTKIKWNYNAGDDMMMSDCEAFCGKANVPLLMGSKSYGFNLKTMNNKEKANNNDSRTNQEVELY